MNDQIRIGLLIDSYKLPAWIVEMIKRIAAIDNVEICLIILNDFSLGNKSAVNHAYPWGYDLYAKLDKILYKALPKADAPADLYPIVKSLPLVKVAPIISEKKRSISNNDMNVIRPYHLDVLIQLGFQNITGEILDLPRLGVWVLDCYQDKPVPFSPGAVQFFNNEVVTGSAVKQRSNDPGKERILYQSISMTDKKSLNRNLNKLYWKSLSFIPRLLTILVQNGENRFWEYVNTNVSSSIVGASTTVSNGKIFKTLVSNTWAEFSNRMRAAVHTGRWNLYYCLNENDKLETTMNAFKKIPSPKGVFWADPHAVIFDNKPFIFFEEWDHKKKKGHISVIQFNADDSIPTVSKVLEKPYHLSYPFTFQWNDIYYMIPETAANKTIELYRCTNFPGEWTFVMNLMENVHAVDTTLYFHYSKWWLFANMVENAGAPALDELFIFYADDFLTNKWTAHKMNPVVSDSRNARPAGALFSIGNKTFRPSQCSDRIYGRATNINEITTLTGEDFSEVNIATLAPDGRDSCMGVHSYSKLGSLTFIDKFYSNYDKS